MINDPTGLYKNFNIQQIRRVSAANTVKKDNPIEKEQDNRQSQVNKSILAIPPAIGFGAGVLSSNLYSSDKINELSRGIESYKNGLELGFNANPTIQGFNDEIKKAKDLISEAEADNSRIQNLAKSPIDSINKRNAEMIEINNATVRRQTKYISKLKELLNSAYKEMVKRPLEEYTTEATATAEKQIKQFRLGIIAALTITGVAASYVIHRIKNKSE